MRHFPHVHGWQPSKLQGHHNRACITFSNCAFSSLFSMWTGLSASLQPVMRFELLVLAQICLRVADVLFSQNLINTVWDATLELYTVMLCLQ